MKIGHVSGKKKVFCWTFQELVVSKKCSWNGKSKTQSEYHEQKKHCHEDLQFFMAGKRISGEPVTSRETRPSFFWYLKCESNFSSDRYWSISDSSDRISFSTMIGFLPWSVFYHDRLSVSGTVSGIAPVHGISLLIFTVCMLVISRWHEMQNVKRLYEKPVLEECGSMIERTQACVGFTCTDGSLNCVGTVCCVNGVCTTTYVCK